MKYTTTFKKAVLRKVLPPENRSVHSVSMELGVEEMTIHRWIAQVKDGTINFDQDEENPSGQRNMTEKLNLLLEYQKILQDQNGEWLRQNGLHEEHLNLFQQEIKNLMANKVDDKDKEIKELKKQLAKKDKELKRKDAAYVSDIINLVKAKIISDDVTITLCGCLNGAGEFLISEKMESVTKQWQLENGKLKEPKNIAYYFSKLLPKATVIANTTNVDSGVGLDIPVIYRNGVYTKL